MSKTRSRGAARYLFALGDNRDFSLDSRYWGFVPRALLMGQPWIVYWSYAAPTEALSGSPVNPNAFTARYSAFFTNSRANPILTFLR
jgi:signal peptidase I